MACCCVHVYVHVCVRAGGPAAAPAAGSHKYAITVLVENGGGMGQNGYGNLIAAPVAKKVLEAVLNK